MTDPTPGPPATRQTAGTARLTPYELVLDEVGLEGRTFPAILAEAEAQGVDPAHPERFAFLTRAAEAVREVVPPDASPDALDQYRQFFYHAFNFWRFGKRLYVLEPPVARYLVEAAPDLRGWDLRLPAESAYVQLPANLFWASVAPDAPPEPVDGFFVCCVDREDMAGEPYETFEVLMALGIHRQRAGLSLIHFDTEVGPGIPAVWAESAGRDEGGDFESVLPGGEMAGLYSIVTVQEALKLVARALWYLDRHPGHVSSHDPAERRLHERPGSAPLSRLSFHRVTLDEADGGGGPGA
ncbi:MAG TPA: hypothetical protein VHG51_04325 [Longimicrobiaceae bacterium]|nr:hypothetical protein [Longimicrobiaceae bacterium]